MIKEMRKVQIIGPKNCLDECIRVLHATAVVHIETVPEEISPEEAYFRRLPMEKEKLHEREVLEKARERIKNLLALLPAPPVYRAQKVEGEEIFKLLDRVAPVEESVKALHGRLDDLAEELAVIDRYERLLRGFAPIVSRLGGLKNFEIIGLTIEKAREDVARLLSEEVGRITGGNYEIHVKDIGGDTLGIVLTFPRKHSPEVKFLISGESINEIRLPDQYEEMPLLSALRTMGRRKEEIPGLMRAASWELEKISTDWYGRLTGLLRAVEDAIDEIGVLAYAGGTRFTFMIEGWVPADMYGQLREKFSAIFGEKVLLRELEVEEKDVDLIPVYIKNPRVLKPFEVFLAALPPPKYGSIDPTPYVALFFPAFFGLIVGDLGYGLVISGVSLYLKRRFGAREIFSDIFSVLTVCGLSAALFGVLFGEFFGDLGARLGILHPVLFDRVEALRTLLVLTLGIGVGHVVLGLFIGAVNRLYRGKTKEAGVKAAHLALIAAFLSMLAVMAGYLPKGLLTPAVAALVAGFAVLVVIEGVLGPLEFIKTLGNMLSYVRIMAVGTASVVMAVVANRIGGVSENVLIGVIAAGLIHLLNILISFLSPVIQSMRLQYVEFFSKFYEAGGRRYRPFRKR